MALPRKKNATISITEGNYSHDVVAGTAKYHVQGDLTEVYSATQKTTVANDITSVCTGGPIALSSGAKDVFVEAITEITLVVGASTIHMDSGGKIEISGQDVAITGEKSVTITGALIHSEAKDTHQTVGNIVLSDGKSDDELIY